MTDAINWTKAFDETNNPPIPNIDPIDPLPYTGGDEHFSVKITDKEVEELKDLQGIIRFEKVYFGMVPSKV